MATHCSILAWRIPGTEEPGRLPSMGSHGVGHDRSDLAAAAAAGAAVYCQCNSLSSFHLSCPHLCPQVCSLHLHLFSLILALQIGSSVPFFQILYIYDTCFSLSVLLHSYLTLGSFTSLPMTQFHSFLWLSNIPFCIFIFYKISFKVRAHVTDQQDQSRILRVWSGQVKLRNLVAQREDSR